MPTFSTLILGEISYIQNISIQSLLKNNYEIIIYSYQELSNIPQGVVLKDARHVLDESPPNIHDSSKFINLFKFTLLHRVNTIWIENNFLFDNIDDIIDIPIIISSNPDYSSLILRIPKNSIILKDAIETVKKYNNNTSQIIKYLVNKYSLHQYVIEFNFPIVNDS